MNSADPKILGGALAGALLVEQELWIPLAIIAAGATALAWVARVSPQPRAPARPAR